MTWKPKLFLLAVLFLVGCAHHDDCHNCGGGYRESRESADESYEVPVESRAHPAAYQMDAFVIRKKSPQRSPSSDMNFFFKTCEQGPGRDYYSRTSYNCD